MKSSSDICSSSSTSNSPNLTRPKLGSITKSSSSSTAGAIVAVASRPRSPDSAWDQNKEDSGAENADTCQGMTDNRMQHHSSTADAAATSGAVARLFQVQQAFVAQPPDLMVETENRRDAAFAAAASPAFADPAAAAAAAAFQDFNVQQHMFRVKQQQLLQHQLLEQQYHRGLELLQAEHERQLSLLMKQMETHRKDQQGASVASLSALATPDKEGLKMSSAADVSGEELIPPEGGGGDDDCGPGLDCGRGGGGNRERLEALRQKSRHHESAVASPEVKRHLQEFVKKRLGTASMTNLKMPSSSNLSGTCGGGTGKTIFSAGQRGGDSGSSSAASHVGSDPSGQQNQAAASSGGGSLAPNNNGAILRKTASESNLLKMKTSKRGSAEGSFGGFGGGGGCGPRTGPYHHSACRHGWGAPSLNSREPSIPETQEVAEIAMAGAPETVAASPLQGSPSSVRSSTTAASSFGSTAAAASTTPPQKQRRPALSRDSSLAEGYAGGLGMVAGGSSGPASPKALGPHFLQHQQVLLLGGGRQQHLLQQQRQGLQPQQQRQGQPSLAEPAPTSSANSRSLPNIPSAVSRFANKDLLGNKVGRRSPPTSSGFRSTTTPHHHQHHHPHHSAMLVKRSKSSAILPLRKHLIEKTLMEQKAFKDDFTHLQHHHHFMPHHPSKGPSSSGGGGKMDTFAATSSQFTLSATTTSGAAAASSSSPPSASSSASSSLSCGPWGLSSTEPGGRSVVVVGNDIEIRPIVEDSEDYHLAAAALGGSGHNGSKALDFSCWKQPCSMEVSPTDSNDTPPETVASSLEKVPRGVPSTFTARLGHAGLSPLVLGDVASTCAAAQAADLYIGTSSGNGQSYQSYSQCMLILQQQQQQQQICKTGLGFDSDMLLHQCECQNGEIHPENPLRVQSIWEHLVKVGLVDRCVKVSRSATLEEIQLVHSRSHAIFYASSNCADPAVGDVERGDQDTGSGNGGKSGNGSQNLRQNKLSLLRCGGVGVDSDTFWNESHTPRALRAAVGCVIELSTKVTLGELRNGFAIVRPPGHHAEAEEAMGFCYLNSVAIAAKKLIATQLAKRVLIIDWAIHHGNGTQQAFYDSPDVLYISLHRYDNGNFYPGTGGPAECGAGPGLGYNVNIAWVGGLDPPMADAEYLAAFRSVVMPVARAFDPSIVLVSAGFDAAVGHPHPIGGYVVSTACFAYLTLQLKQLAQGKVVLALEGGYDVDTLKVAAEQCVLALSGSPIDKISEVELARKPNQSAMETLQKALAIHSPYWEVLRRRPESALLSHLEAWEKERSLSLLECSNLLVGGEDEEEIVVGRSYHPATEGRGPPDEAEASGTLQQALQAALGHQSRASGVLNLGVSALAANEECKADAAAREVAALSGMASLSMHHQQHHQLHHQQHHQEPPNPGQQGHHLRHLHHYHHSLNTSTSGSEDLESPEIAN